MENNADYIAPAGDAPPVSVPGLKAMPADQATLSANLVALRDQHLRLAADFENFRKRTRRDAAQEAVASKEAFILELLPVLDNLERALAAEPAHQGVGMVLRQLAQLLGRHGVEEAEEIGRPFDPHRHEAVLMRHDRAQPDQVVLAVLQHGYCRDDKVLRTAKVVVNSHTPETGDAP